MFYWALFKKEEEIYHERLYRETPEMSNKQIIWLPELGQLVPGDNSPTTS